MACDARLYDPVIPLLSGVEMASVVGRGQSIAENVAQVLDAAPQRFIVLGTSFGARVALETTLAAPDRVMGLVVIGSGPKGVADPAAGLKREARIRGGEFDTVVREMADMVSHLPAVRGPMTRQAFIDMAATTGAEVMANQAAAMARRIDVSDRLHEIRCPALMLWGREDKFSPAADGLAMANAMPNARYVEIAECGHFPTLEAPEETGSIIQHWLSDQFSLQA